MKQEIKLTQALGKTLEGVAFSITCGQAVLVFTDGTFATLGTDGWSFKADSVGVEEAELELDNFGDA